MLMVLEIFVKKKYTKPVQLLRYSKSYIAPYYPLESKFLFSSRHIIADSS
jgi:hypothetical protein